MNTGFLKVQSFAARESAVVPEVLITLTSAEGNCCCPCCEEKNGPFVFTTDQEGNAESLSLPAPDRSLSLDINNDTVPYSVWNLTAQKEGYQTVRLEGIQVFSGSTAEIILEMLPIQRRGAPQPKPETFITPPHSLVEAQAPTGKAPTEPLDPPRILEAPIIPEKITVHLGKPGASARNVTVSFRHYIANVASSEVYPTWPDAALRANIHAQISLALNRIYTEWYPSKGYSFNITNSTSYDQYYVHGRNIFAVMEDITDQIFNTYVRKKGTVEPFYTEYCDGKQVSCPGMKQWGTVDRAKEGKDALQILKYYYGNSIEIVRTQNIQSIRESYPGSPLRRGDRGKEVKILQRQLTRIVKDYPFMGQPTTDGIFGAKTESTVKAFQKQFRLTADGVVGRATWYKISYIYASVKDLAELTSEGEKPTGDQDTINGAGYPGSPLRRGDRGNSVTQIQFWLQQLSEFTPGLFDLSVDGVFGSGTEKAVIAFQEKNGLMADGIVGRTTWQLLYARYQSLKNDTNQSSNGYPGKSLRVGSRGDSVRRMQFWLRIISTNYTTIDAPAVDGIFGSDTQRSVRAFQAKFGLTVDGIVGPATWEKLYQLYADITNDLLDENQRPGVYPGSALRLGSTGKAVREAQYYLVLMSAYYTSIPRINIDGEFGAATKKAVIAFQTLNGLEADGIIGPATWQLLYEQSQILRADSGLIHVYNLLPWPGIVQSEGFTGQDVAFIQYLLQYIGYFYDTVQPPKTVDGIYGPATTNAVLSYQLQFGLPQTGSVDEFCWNAMSGTFASLAAGGSEEVRDKALQEYPGYVMAQGSLGGCVLQLQQGLNQLSAVTQYTGFIPENGIFGEDTHWAVLDFQSRMNITPTGTVQRETWDALFGEISKNGCSLCSREKE